MAQVLATVRARVGRLLTRRQLEPEDDSAPPDALAEASPVLAGLVGASVQGRVALDPASAASATSRTSVTSAPAAPAKPSSTASISTPTSGCL